MADTIPSPPSTPPKTSHGVNMLRNVITGVLTTVAGAVALYYLKFNKNGDSTGTDILVKKDATTKAWKDYVTIENIEHKNSTALFQQVKSPSDVDNFKTELMKESDKFNGDIQDILKTDNIDPAFTSLLKRRLDAEKEATEKWNTFFDSYKKTMNSTQPGQDQTTQITTAYNKLISDGKFVTDRLKTEITDLTKTLNDKYGQSFNTDDLLLFKEQQQNVANNNNTQQGTNANQTNTTATNDAGGQNNGGNTGTNTAANYTEPNTNGNSYNSNGGTNGNTTVSPQTLIGEWDTPGAVITLSANGEMYWDMNTGQSTAGTWRYYNNQIYMTYPNQYGVMGTNVFNIYNLRSNSFTMQLTTNTNYVYQMKRSNSNY